MKTKNVLITGAGTGIGKDSVKSLLARGHKVYATTHYDTEVDALKNELGEKAEVFKLDITSADDRQKIADLEIDVLINNAAIDQGGSLAEVDIQKVKNIFEVNLFSSLALTQIAIKNMISRGGGTIVFISSITGRIPAPFMMPYSMTKYAVSAAAAGLREEMKVLSKGINVCVVEPGPFHTGFNQKLAGSMFGEESLFSPAQIEKVKKDTDKQLGMLESKSTSSLINKIVIATESDNPKLRYVAPLHIAILVRLMRIFGV